MKKYPISVAKHDHDLFLIKNKLQNEGIEDPKFEEAYEAYTNGKTGPFVSYVEGKYYGVLKQAIDNAQEYRFQANRKSI